jgi:hypothetical protein
MLSRQSIIRLNHRRIPQSSPGDLEAPLEKMRPLGLPLLPAWRHQLGGGEDLSPNPAPDGPERHPGKRGDLPGSEVFPPHRHFCLSDASPAGSRVPSSHARAACRASRRTRLVSAAAAESTSWPDFGRAQFIAARIWEFGRAVSQWGNESYFRC